MLFIRQSVAVIKMRVLTAQLGRPVVHHLDKRTDIPADMLPHRISAFIGRGEHNPVQTLLHRHLLAHVSCDSGTLRLIHGIFGKRDNLVHLAVLNRQKRRKDLCNTGRIMNVVDIFFIENGSRFRIHNNPG